MKKSQSLAALFALALLMTSPLVFAMENESGETDAPKTTTVLSQEKTENEVETDHSDSAEKADHQAKLQQHAQKKACLKKSHEDRQNSVDSARQTYLDSLKSDLQTFHTEMKAAKDTFLASAKDQAARDAFQAAKKAARTKYYDAVKSEQKTFRGAKDTARETEKDTAENCNK